MTQYFMILADTELELVPKELLGERCILNNARARGKPPEKILLDASHHHPAFAKIPESERRGRPDIAHFFLLLCLDSDISAQGNLRVFVHTRNDDVIAVNPETRLPPHYPRFVGLIESLYEQRVVPSKDNPLLELRQGISLARLIEALKPDETIIFTPAGEELPLLEKFSSIKAERVAIVIGGFSKGDFRSDISKIKATRISMGKRMLKAFTVTSRVLAAMELAQRAQQITPTEAAPPAPSRPRRAPRKKAA